MGQPKKRRLLAELKRRAEAELGEGATPLEYIEDYLQGGGMLARLAEDIASTMGESCSRPFLSNTVNGLSDDAKERIGLARREGAGALVEDALKIADAAPETSAGVLKAKAQTEIRKWVAEKFAPEQFGTKTQTTVNLSYGQLHLEALQAAAVAPRAPAVRALNQPIEEEASYVDAD